MQLPETFNNPFRYAPHPLIKEAAESLIKHISQDEYLHSLFCEGKMLGVLWAEKDGNTQMFYAFSGLAGGKSHIEGFVPPIFDLTDPQAYFKQEEQEIARLNKKLKDLSPSKDSSEISRLKCERKNRSIALQEWLFRQYKIRNAHGECSDIVEIFAQKGLVAPGGTGDCALPKLLQFAYLNAWTPLASGEFWYGQSPVHEPRIQGHFYPSCTGKCGPLLQYMLQGLNWDSNALPDEENYSICHQDDWLIVANKPSGMLSVPGKTGKASLQERLEKRFSRKIFACHRLDMDTSGLIVFALDLDTQKSLQRQFENRETEKSYQACLVPSRDPNSIVLHKGDQGEISLPLMPDYYERPRQKVDFEDGKNALTVYEVLEITPRGETRVRLTPLTGRTHQLRVHCAHPSGLGRPIKGDFLYGGVVLENDLCEHPRLQLIADRLSFIHPATNKKIIFKL